MKSQSSDQRGVAPLLSNLLWLSLGDLDPAALVPLSHPGGIELLRLIASPDGAKNGEWETTLTHEPGLAVWVVYRARAAQGLVLSALSQAAAWLVAHGRRELLSHWPVNRGIAPRQIELAAARWSELVTTAVQTVLATDRPNQHTEALESADRWLALLRGAAPIERWLRSGVDASWVSQVIAQLTRLDRLERDFQNALEAEKMEAVKELAYGAGHEINNPLANISARAQTLLEEEHDPERRRRLAAINAQAFRAHEMIADMMLFARPPAPRLARIAVNEVAQTIARGLESLAAEQATTLTYLAPTMPLIVNADATQLAVAIRALVVNGLEALGEGGEVTVIARAAVELQRVAEVVVSDNGPGIPAEIRPRIFDPYFSGREAGRGIGFGLCKSWRIITGHGGSLSVGGNPGGGAVFTIRLPLAVESAAS